MPVPPYPKAHCLAEYPHLTPEEVGRRVLTLISQINAATDLNRERVERVLGFALEPTPDKRLLVFRMDLPDTGWSYTIRYHTEFEPGSSGGFHFLFEPDDNPVADMAPVCGLDFMHYYTALKAMEFGIAEHVDKIGRRIGWPMYKNPNIQGLLIDQHQAPAPEAKRHHACLKSLVLNFDN